MAWTVGADERYHKIKQQFREAFEKAILFFQAALDYAGEGFPLERTEINDILEQVCTALMEKDYIPVEQIMGYILEGDPTYITNHKQARAQMEKIGHKVLLREVLTYYLSFCLTLSETDRPLSFMNDGKES